MSVHCKKFHPSDSSCELKNEKGELVTGYNCNEFYQNATFTKDRLKKIRSAKRSAKRKIQVRFKPCALNLNN